jgi:hypothetical protein
MMLIIQVGNGLAQGLYASSGAVFSGGHGDINGVGPGEAASNVVLYLGSALAQISPFVWVFQEAVLAGALSAPDDTRRGTAGVKAGMWHVSFVGIAELPMNLGLDL